MAGKNSTDVDSGGGDTKPTKPIRLDVAIEDAPRVQAAAKRLGLSMSAYARMALYERLERDENR